ncbi:protocadherin fat [Plakobranchus ocellatus]|uniref:Protocadherin fat n=1 Tax=Plakobranchus ocellatus TaxID=259542 RepID=A0AAV3Y2M0_9GAST|nr:protocadherin fat [Plakobranchus ocellatus]
MFSLYIDLVENKAPRMNCKLLCLNGVVRYSIVGGPNLALFAIGPINGSLYTTGPLDREVTPLYKVVVMATDQAPNAKDRMSTTATVEVKLRDINNSPPVFLTPPTIHVPETAPVGSTVYTIVAEDADEKGTPNSRIQYTLVSQTRASPPTFSLEPDTGALVLLAELDRETLTNHSLVIRARDGVTDSSSPTTSPPHVTELRLHVLVDDANDNAPEFTEAEYLRTVAEDVAVGTSLLRVLASDKDQGFNGAVRYFIVGGAGSHDFHLDATSGVLRVQKALDFERVSNYSLQVQALDSSVESPSLSANTTVTIQVTDINDFVPVFDDSPYHTFVQEGMPDGPVPVMTVRARDDDSAENGRLQYSLWKVSSSPNFFRVEPISGAITVLKTLDRETTPMYVLTIVARDGGKWDAVVVFKCLFKSL